ncbi:MAG TPA: sortase [Mycobacteriales bacterium]|jgi:hypothetical protein|nr:sortase [Mycobacteriales bacterium]
MKQARHIGSHRRIVASVAVGALILSGAAVLGAALVGPGHPSADPDRAAVTPRAGRDESSMTTASPSGGAPAPLGASAPVRLKIPAMAVDGALLQLDVQTAQAGQQDGQGAAQHPIQTVQLPSPARQAGWYERSATPGSAGTSVIIGYIADNKGKPAAFGRLAQLRTHDTVTVVRQDGRDAIYTVDRIHGYRPGTLPTEKIYAATPTPSLRLISCGGALHHGAPAENVVVSAHLTTIDPVG